jgi:hypothetical protein
MRRRRRLVEGRGQEGVVGIGRRMRGGRSGEKV